MMPTHGYKARVYAPGFNLNTFLRSTKIGCSKDIADSTVFASNGDKEFTAGLREGTLTAEGLWVGRPTIADDIDPVLEALDDDTARPWLYLPEGDAHANPGRLVTGLLVKRDTETPVDDVNKAEIEVQASDGNGIEHLLVHRALASASVASNVGSTSIDNGASSSDGGVGYLLVTSNATPGTATVKIQHSDDNATWVDLVSFSAVNTANKFQRVAVGGTIERYTRCIHTVATGAVTFHASFGRK